MRIMSIFKSIDGEVNCYGQGSRTTFIRFAGCNLDPPCPWCDTRYAHSVDSGMEYTVEKVMEAVKLLGPTKITITGGEPLMQPMAFSNLTRELYQNKYVITVETNGSLPLIGWGVAGWVIDYKLPSSGHEDKMQVDKFTSQLRGTDIIKFVVKDRIDFRRAVAVREKFKSYGMKARFAFSPVFGEMQPKELLHLMDVFEINDGLLNVQLHKYIGVA